MTHTLDWLRQPCAIPDAAARAAAQQRQATLTKPAGSLGQLEQIALQLAALQGTPTPKAERIHIAVFAGDHGVAEEGISAFPQSVTGEMVRNFARGGAAINAMARALGAELHVINLGTVQELEPLPGVTQQRLGPGTANFAKHAAMTPEQLAQALTLGATIVASAQERGAQIFIGGEMGIGNSTSAAALATALLGVSAATLAGPGTGVDAHSVLRKVSIIQRALERHADSLDYPVEVLRRVGGFEIAALVGSYIACAQRGIPALIDGFIATSAALVATRILPGANDWFIYGHASAEPGHRTILAALGARPLLDLGMRLGEGTGAAAAVSLLRMACATHNDMATFAHAGVSEKIT